MSSSLVPRRSAALTVFCGEALVLAIIRAQWASPPARRTAALYRAPSAMMVHSYPLSPAQPGEPVTDDQSQLHLRSRCRASSAGSAVITAQTSCPMGSGQLGSRSSQPGRLWVRRGLGPPSQGAAAVHTTPIAVPIRGEDRRARHLGADALSGVRDPQWPAEVAHCRGEPSAAVERQQLDRLTRLAGVY